MGRQLTYVLITPYTLLKSRTGGIIGRMLALSENVRFVGARMYAPSDAMIDAYLETLDAEKMPQAVRKALAGYVDTNLRRENPFGINNRMPVLFFEGPDAISSLQENAVGELSLDVRGDTLRGTYGDFVSAHGKLAFFEPAVLMPTNEEANRRQLKVLSDYAVSDGGILTDVVQYDDRSRVETTLVIIKPDNFWRRSARAGNIIDVFSRAGLYIVGVKVLRMTQEQADEFYGPLRGIFVEKLKDRLAGDLGEALERGFDFAITEEMKSELADALKEANAEHEFQKIVDYMTGQDEGGGQVPAEDRGTCVALLYQGEDAVAKIRERLGATNPEEAQDGTVRSIYGYDLMKNGAHASDSPGSAERERKIVGLWKEGPSVEAKDLIDRYLAEG